MTLATLADDVSAVGALPAWWPEAVVWLGLGLLIACGAAAFGVWALTRRLERLRSELGSLATLGEIQRTLAHLVSERDDLDLRRIEHVLIDLRDGSRRLEDLLLRAADQRAVAGEALVPIGSHSFGERVTTRLMALGYERIELVTSPEELEGFGATGGDVLVEARREGVLCKGRVRLRGGRIDSVQLQPAFATFP